MPLLWLLLFSPLNSSGQEICIRDGFSPNEWLVVGQKFEHSTHIESFPIHLIEARKYVGIVEVTKNSSPDIDRWLRYCGLNPGNPYCASFVSTMIGEAKVKAPKIRSGLARKFITPKSIPAGKVLLGMIKIEPGAIIVWQNGNTIFGHVGFVIKWDKDKGTTVEANTGKSNRGSQSDGEGVWKRSRAIVPGNMFRITYFTKVSYKE